MIAEVGSPSPPALSPTGRGRKCPASARRNSSRGGNSRPKYARVILVIVPCDHPFGTEAPAGPPGRGFFLNSCQIFPSSKGFPKHLLAMKGVSDGAPSPSPVPALGTRSPAPPCGASLFCTSPRGHALTAHLPLGERTTALRSGEGADSIRAVTPPHPTLSPTGRDSPPRCLRLKPGNPTPGGGLFQQRTCFPPTPHHQVAGPDSCVSVLEAPALPRGFFFAPHV